MNQNLVNFILNSDKMIKKMEGSKLRYVDIE